ncbi:unnamed protein product [Cuscuta campestris]|uniref:SGNH hydrolase-type esterase domain-containing protein n=1 Tax=Cuscuta campestris TaxID=132261 RepID=A0A484L4G7_9ASTE|nr:unnamed protein product [Cuscuta campestris]
MVGTKTRPQFVLFGSSIVQFSYSHEGWGAILADLYARKADIVLRGYTHWNSRHALQVLHEIFPKNADVQPSLVIVYFGGNDSKRPGLNEHVPLSEYVENMRKIASHLKSLSNKTRIIFLTCPPVNEAQILEVFGDIGRSNKLSQKYSDACVDLCKELDDVKAIDLWTALQQKDDWLTTCFTDGIHLTSEGSKIVVKEILKVLKEADWEPSLHWKSLPTEFSEVFPTIVSVRDGTTANVSDFVFKWQTQWD